MVQIGLLTRYLVLISFSFNGMVTNISNSFVLAQTATEVKIPDRDPLLPPSNLNRELSPLEKKRIKTEIDNLDVEANSQFRAGKTEEAWQLWLRQLRLYRALGFAAEIPALGTVGEKAWQTNRKGELKAISDRFEEIYRDLKSRELTNPEYLIILGISARQIRNLDTAISIYQKLLKDARQQDDFTLEEKYLAVLGEIYFNKFDYQQAENIYQELLYLEDNYPESTNSNSVSKFSDYSNQLIKVYNYLQQPKQSLTIKQQLIDYYLERGDRENIANLKIAIGDDYQALDRLELAISSYQEAVTISESEQQIALLNEALKKSGQIYERQQEFFLAIKTYQKSIEISQKVGDSYSLMNNYDRLGHIYLLLENYGRASLAFSQGLEIANTLNYRIDYFRNLLQQAETKNN